MKKAFIVANVRDILDQYNADEISFSKMVELFNEKAAEYYDPQINAIIEGSDNWQQEYNDCREILESLVALKEIKDTEGKTADYIKHQPIEWERAKQFLKKYQHINS